MGKKRLSLSEQVEQDNLNKKSPFNNEGVKLFVKDAMGKMGKVYSDEKADKIIEHFNYDYDKLIDDAANKTGIKDIEAFRQGVYNKYGFSKPDDLQLAEMSFVKKPISADPEGGFEKYKELEDELNLAKTFISDIKSSQPTAKELESPTEISEEYKLLESQFLTHPSESTKIEIPDKDQYLEPTDPRILDIQKKADEIAAALREQSDYNMKKLGYASEKHESVKNEYNSYVAKLQEAKRLRFSPKGKFADPNSPTVGYMDITPIDREKIKNLEDITEIYSKMGKLLGAPKGEGFDKQAKALLYGLGRNFFTKDFVTLGINEFSRLSNVKDAFDTKQKLLNEGKTEEEINQIIPSEELALIDTYQMLLEIQAGADPNSLYYWGEGLKDMIPFIVQFAATGGVGAGAKKAVSSYVKKKTSSAIAGKIAGFAAKPLAQGAAMVPANLQGYAERVAPTLNEKGELVEGMNPLKAAVITYANTVAEVAGEDVGTYLNKSANKVARKSYQNMIGRDYSKAEAFLGKMALALTKSTDIPSLQGVVFEGLGEEVTGILQAVINQDDSFFTSEAQKQIWGMSLIASGTYMTASTPRRLKARSDYNNSRTLLNDITNEEYANSIESLSQNYNNIEELTDAWGEINKQFGTDITQEDKAKSRAFIEKAVVFNQMNTARAIQLEEQISQSVGQDGNITLAEYNGIPYSVRNPQDLGKDGKVIILKNKEGNVIPVISSKITNWDGKPIEQVINEQITAQDQQDSALEAEQQTQEETLTKAIEKGLEEGKTVITPQGKKTLVSVNPDGTSTVQNDKGEQTTVNTDEIEAYKTQEQKEAEKAQEKTELEGQEAVSDEPLFEGSETRVIDYANGTSKIISPEGEQMFDTPEERDAAIETLVSAELEAAEATIDDLPPEQAFAQMLQEDPEIANEVLTQDIADIRAQAEESRAQTKEAQTRQERVNLLKQAKELETEAVRLESILADPSLLEEKVEEEVVEEPIQEEIIERTPDVIYSEYQDEKLNAPINRLLPWQEVLLTKKVNKNSFIENSDKANVTPLMSRAWFTSDKSKNLDVIAQEISSETGMDITEQDIVDFIIDNSSGSVRKTTDRMNELQKEYKEVAGKPITQHETKPSLTEEDLAEIPFRTTEGVNLTDKAQKDLVAKTRIAPTLEKLQETFGIPVQIINSKEMPEHVKRAAKGKNITASGFYDPSTGTAYILSDIAKTKGIAEIKKTYMHEAVLHKGLDVLFEAGPVKVLGKSFKTKNELLDEVFNRLDKETIADRAKYYTKDISLDQLTDQQKRELAEEAMATLNETESPRLQVFIDKLYNYIKKLFGFTSKQFTKAEFRQLLRDHRDLIIKQKQDAEAIRTDEGRIPEAGIIQEVSDAKSSKDIQQPEKARAEAGEAERVKFQTDDNKNFDEWKGDNELVEDYQISDVKTGKPIVAKAYHGTTHSFYEFKGGEVGEIQSHLGKTNYFTSEYGDAQINYGEEGPDLTNRIENLKERIEQELEYETDQTYDEMYSYISENYPDFDVSSLDEDLSAKEIAERVSENKLKGDEEQVLELYVKLNNPLVLGSGPVYIETINEAEIADYLDDAAEEISDENGIEIEEAKEDYSFDIQQRAIELSGAEDRVVEAMRLALEGNEVYDKTLYDLLPNYYGDEVDLNQIDKDLRASEELMYLDNDEGRLINHQIISDFYEELGYDGVILTDVNERFPSMNLDDGVSHIQVPDQYNNQIKLADGSNTTFGETPDIRFRQTETPEFKKWFGNSQIVDEQGNPLVHYHATGEDFDAFKTQTDEQIFGKGIIFASPDAKWAQEGFMPIDKEKGTSGSVMPIYVKSENPFDYNNEEHLNKLFEKVELRDKAKDKVREGSPWGLEKPKVIEAIKELGFDGLYVTEEGMTNIGVFNPNQVKSAIGNIVTFDPKVDDVRFRTDEEGVKFKVADSQQELDDFVKDSKIKTTVYHGTPIGGFTEFKEGDPIWVTPNQSYAEAFARGFATDDKGQTYNVRVNLNNPAFIGDIDGIANDNKLDRLSQMTGIDNDTLKRILKESGGNNVFYITRTLEFKELMQEKGFDGLEAKEGRTTSYAAFSPDQILIEPKEDVKFKIEEERDKVETVNAINNEHGWDYKIQQNGRIFSKFMGKKQYITFDDLLSKSKTLEENKIINDNLKQVKSYLSDNGFKRIYTSKSGTSSYWSDGNITVRLSNHKLQSHLHEMADINAFSNKDDGYKEVVSEIQQLKARFNTEINPSESQIEAGNYQKGHIKFDGFDISIENPRGSIRKGQNEKGEEWSNIMPADYGYFKGTIGKDKDHIDVFLGDNLESNKVYIVDQVNPETGLFDEHKVLMGYNSLSEAKNAYLEGYEEGWQGLGAITRTTKDGLKEWFKGDTKKPFALGDEVKFQVTSTDPKIQAMLDKLEKVQALSKTAARIKGIEQEKLQSLGPERKLIETKLEVYKEAAEAGKEEAKELIKEVQSAIRDYAKKSLPLTEAGAREIGPILTLIKNSQSPKDIEAAFNRIDELAGISTEKQERRKYVSKVNRLLKWMTGLKKSGTKRVGKFNYEDTTAFQELKSIEKQVSGLTKTINSNKATAEAKVEATTKLDSLWDELNEKENKTSLDDAIMKLVELRRLGSKASSKLAQIVAEELEAIYSQAKDAKTEADIDAALSRKEEKEFVKQFLTGDDKALKDKPWFKRASTQLNTGIADVMGNWETIMTMIGGQKLRDKTSLMLNEAQIAVGRQKTMDNVLNEAKDVYGSKSRKQTLDKVHDLSKEGYSLRKPNRKGEKGQGKPTELSKLHLMDIYNATKNEDVANDYYMSYGDITLAEDGSRDKEAQRISGKKTIDALLNNLDPQDKAFADAMQIELDKYYEKLNEVHIKLYNRDLPRVENYWPSTAEREVDIDVMEQFFADSKHPSATKERSAHRIPEPRDAFNKFSKHIDEAEWYINMALPINDINKVFKDKNIENLIVDNRGQSFYDIISGSPNKPGLLQMMGLNSPVNTPSKLTSWLNPLLNNWVVSKIGATPSVPLKQLLSSVNYAENMPAEQWASGFIKSLANPKKTWEEMMKIPYLKTRLGDGYSEAVQRALNGDENVHKSRVNNFHSSFKNLMTIGTRYGDIAAIVFGGKPYLDYLIKKEGLSEKEAVDKFLQDTLRSQQAPFSSTLSKLQNSKNPFFRAVFAFSNTPSQYMRKMFEVNQNLRVQQQQFQDGKITKEELNEAKKKAVKAHAIYGMINTVSFTMTGALINAAMRGSDPDDEVWRDIVNQLGQTYLGGLPVIKDLIGTATRKSLGMPVYDSAKPFIEGIDEVVDAGIKLSSGKAKNPEKEYEKIAQGVATMLGIPYYNLKKDIKAIPPFRERTVTETRIKEVDNKLKTLDSGIELKKAYTKAKSKATRYRNNNQPYMAEIIDRMIEDSKMKVWDNNYDDLSNEAMFLENMLDSID